MVESKGSSASPSPFPPPFPNHSCSHLDSKYCASIPGSAFVDASYMMPEYDMMLECDIADEDLWTQLPDAERNIIAKLCKKVLQELGHETRPLSSILCNLCDMNEESILFCISAYNSEQKRQSLSTTNIEGQQTSAEWLETSAMLQPEGHAPHPPGQFTIPSSENHEPGPASSYDAPVTHAANYLLYYPPLWPADDVYTELDYAVSVIARLMEPLVQCLEQIPDDTEGREAKRLKLWQTTRRPLNIDYAQQMAQICTYAAPHVKEMALQNRLAADEVNPYAVLLQQILVLANTDDQIMLINELRSVAKLMIFHECGCFVVSQMLEEAKMVRGQPNPIAHTVLEFMADAYPSPLARPADFREQIYNSMRHRHANHSIRLWIKVLGQNPGRRPNLSVLEAMLQVVQEKMELLINHCHGCRNVNAILDFYLRHDPTKVASIANVLVQDGAKLYALMLQEFANHTIQKLVSLKTREIGAQISQNLVHLCTHRYGNYVVHSCIDCPAYLHWWWHWADTLCKNRHLLNKRDDKRPEMIKRSLASAMLKNKRSHWAQWLEIHWGQSNHQRF